MDTLYLVLPAYNEEANIEAVVRAWHAVAAAAGPQSRLLVVNDGSKDGTGALLARLAKQLPALIALEKPNGGHGPAILYGYRQALAAGADYIFQTDTDGQTLPEEFGPFWQQREQYDMIIGHRAHRQDGLGRLVVTKTLRLVTRVTLHARTTDPNTPYRLMKRAFLSECLELIPPDFALPNVLIAAFGARLGRRVLYLPVTFRPRQGGVNSLNLRRITRIGFQALRDFRAVDRQLKAKGL